jgi:transcriptional regulator with PAS, ATPase and Fis domain
MRASIRCYSYVFSYASALLTEWQCVSRAVFTTVLKTVVVIHSVALKFYCCHALTDSFVAVLMLHRCSLACTHASTQHEYEITFNSDSEIHPVDDDKKIKAMNLNFTKIAGLKDVEIGSQTDVIAVVKDYTDMTTIMTKNNKEVSLIEQYHVK